MVRIFKYISCLGALLLLFSCEKEYKVPGTEAVKSYVALNVTTQQIHEIIDFGDMSSGVSSRLWTFPEGVTDIIGSDNNVTSTEAIVHAKFNTPGFYSVRLNTVFKGKLLDDGPLMDSTVVDTTFIVNIIDSVRAGITARYLNSGGYDSVKLDLRNGAKNQLWAGEYVRFTFDGGGAPDQFIWDVLGAVPEYTDGADNTIVIQFKQLGVYSITHIPYREYPEGSDTIKYVDLIEVIPSPRPVKLIQILKRGRRELALDFSRAIKVPGPTEKDNFTLSVRHQTEYLDINVANVSLDPDLSNMVVLNLDADVYDDDVILVSYTPGTLISEDEKEVDAFTDISPISIKESVLPDNFNGGFEDLPYNWSQAAWDPPYDKIRHSLSEEYSHTGSRSMRIDLEAGDAGAVTNGIAVTFEEGVTYELSFYFLTVEECSDDALSSIAVFSSSFDGNHASTYSYHALADWYQVTKEWEPGADDLSFFIRASNINSDKAMIMYFDDLDVFIVDKRPE